MTVRNRKEIAVDRGTERRRWIAEALEAAGLDALVCSLPENVLLLTGYWPVVGTSVAVATPRDCTVIAPEDEKGLAEGGWATVRTYQPGSLETLPDPASAVPGPLGDVLRELGVAGGRIGHDDFHLHSESSYSAVYLFRGVFPAVLAAADPTAAVEPARDPISRLRSRMTPEETGQVRLACEVADSAFGRGRAALQPGRAEPEVAADFEAPLSILGLARGGVTRAGGFTWCMSGPNSALAGAAYARTRNRELQAGDLVLVHCNSYVNGYWTDITRTYCLGTPSARQQEIYGAILKARQAALEAIRPGAYAADVDAAARRVLAGNELGQYFTHGLGHNVGFSAISAEFPPTLHPASTDVLQVGMTFNVEPSVYIAGYGGVRHCDVVTLGEDGPEVLTPFHATLDSLTVSL
jgi:Xaa-Pro aminopeptidase/Xaa-Pro dipeptidase